MAEKKEENKLIPRVAPGGMLPRVMIGALGISGIGALYGGLEPETGTNLILGAMVASIIVGWFYQKRYDQETRKGLEENTMYIKKDAK